MQDIIAIGIVAVIVIAAVLYIINRRRKGGPACGCSGCSGCSEYNGCNLNCDAREREL